MPEDIEQYHTDLERALELVEPETRTIILEQQRLADETTKNYIGMILMRRILIWLLGFNIALVLVNAFLIWWRLA